MTDKELIEALGRLKVETGSLACISCGREHNCGIHGCAIIREAKDRIAALTSPWISVDDRLPETDDDVIAIVSGKPKRNILLDKAPMLASYWRDGWYVNDYPGWENPEVTYWMSIPEMPEKRGEVRCGFEFCDTDDI